MSLINSPVYRLRNVLKLSAAIAGLLAGQSMHAQVFFTGSYLENFDNMGASGTVPPVGWSMKVGPSGTTNNTWNTSITGSGVAALIATPGALTAAIDPPTTNNNGFNAASTGSTTNRSLATSPTSVSGSAIQLQLTNNTGAAINALNLSYDIRRFTAAGTANELPGYWLFYSVNGTSWTNFSTLNPTLAGPGVTVPNTVGTTNVATAGFSFGGAWNNNASLFLRWVDDNAFESSPDQIVGLDNVGISVIPEPACTAFCVGAATLVGLVSWRRRQALKSC